MDRQPDQARAALDDIKLASAEALREVRSVLDALYPAGQAALRAPAPRLGRLDELTVDAGLPVRTTMSGTPRALPAEIDRAAYRIVQEALTNVRRHAGTGATATVMIEYRQEELVMQIEDDGGAARPVTTPTIEGNGLTGMRERATTLGGSLTAHPLPGGGWQVHARLPLPAPEPDGAQ
jgi:signal transduction histidine kinase